MSEDTKKIEKIKQEAKDTELSEESLDKVAGGTEFSRTKSNIKKS